MVILKGGNDTKNVNITDPRITRLSVGDLERDTEYIVNVLARNAVFEGAAAQKTIRTKINGGMSNCFMFLSIYLSIYLSIFLSIYLSVYLSVHLNLSAQDGHVMLVSGYLV